MADDLCNLQPGERRHLRAHVYVYPEFFRMEYPQFALIDRLPLVLKIEDEKPVDDVSLATRATLNSMSNASAVLTSQAGAELHVSAVTKGMFEFDLEIPSTAKADLDSKLPSVRVIDARTGETLNWISYSCAWRGPEVPVVVENLGSKTYADLDYIHEMRFFRLTWPPVQGAQEILLEVAHDEAGANWFPILRYAPSETTCTLVFEVGAFIEYAYRGGLKFRIIPISSKRPGR
jgi:hypothetical protein